MATGKLLIKFTISGFVGGDETVTPGQSTSPGEYSFTPTVLDRALYNFSLGNNTVTCPTGAQFCLFVPPTANTELITLRGSSTDTGAAGVSLNRSMPTLLGLNAQANLLFNCNAISGIEIVFF